MATSTPIDGAVAAIATQPIETGHLAIAEVTRWIAWRRDLTATVLACVLHADSSEHHELDVLARENRACRDEGVAANDEVLCEGVDVAQPTLERAIGVERGATTGAVRGGHNRCGPFDRPHGGRPNVRSMLHRERSASGGGGPQPFDPVRTASASVAADYFTRAVMVSM